ncbi:hypothetical protein LCGC14_2237550 [marine sediment metagenome]|uniref:Uncharacterized protein n=1 Tax=marine sediment metagenome TaxID=412755 RepID=A0A0F9D651_9ZZZZ
MTYDIHIRLSTGGGAATFWEADIEPRGEHEPDPPGYTHSYTCAESLSELIENIQGCAERLA